MFDDVSPVKKSAAFMAFMFMAAVLLFSKVLLPYYDYLKLLSNCTIESSGTVVTEDEPEKDDYLYYGPTVQFSADGFLPVRSRAINTAKSREHFKIGDTVTIGYDGTINSDVIILDDKTVRNNLIIGSVAAGVIALIGVIDFIVHLSASRHAPKGETKEFTSTPDGLSFEEWQERQQKDGLRADDDDGEDIGS